MFKSSRWIQNVPMQIGIVATISLLVSQPIQAQSITEDLGFSESGVNDLGFAGADVCVPNIIDVPPILKNALVGASDELSTTVEADAILTSSEDEIRLSGNAQVTQGKAGIFADEIQFNQQTYALKAQGNVIFYSENGDEIVAEELDLEVDTFIGSAQNAVLQFSANKLDYPIRSHYRFAEDYSMFAPFSNQVGENLNEVADENTYVKSHAKADDVDFEGQEYQLLYNGTLTSCADGSEAVLLTAKEIELDHATGIGSAKSLTVRFQKVPIMYFPRITFPINNERKTGFLSPKLGFKDRSGTVLSLPYYINIAPDHDATVTPTLITKRGLQVYGEFRYLNPQSDGALKAEFLPSDKIFGENRHALSYKHNHRFGENNRWRGDVNFQEVSDTSYFNDFSSDVDGSARTYIPQTANLNYSDRRFNLRMRVSAYQKVNSSVTSRQPYERLPQIDFDLRQQRYGKFAYGADSELTTFVHDDAIVSGRTVRPAGSRLYVAPYVSLPLRKIYGFITPKVSLHTINYSLNQSATGDDSPSVAVPIASIDSGLYFDRFIHRPNTTYKHTLEPRLFYVNIPAETKQNTFPDFGTGGGTISSYSGSLREDRFSGNDRIGDTHHLSVGLTSKIINDDNGKQKFSINFGQVFFFADREVLRTPTSSLDTKNKSDLFINANASFADDWSLRSSATYSNANNELARLSLTANYNHSLRRKGSVAYSRSANNSGHLNVRMETPIAPHWQFEGRADYSLERNEVRVLDTGIFYDGCCWATGLTLQRRLRNGELENQYLITFELDDLGRISSEK